jgi:hypothetical protein
MRQLISRGETGCLFRRTGGLAVTLSKLSVRKAAENSTAPYSDIEKLGVPYRIRTGVAAVREVHVGHRRTDLDFLSY